MKFVDTRRALAGKVMAPRHGFEPRLKCVFRICKLQILKGLKKPKSLKIPTSVQSGAIMGEILLRNVNIFDFESTIRMYAEFHTVSR